MYEINGMKIGDMKEIGDVLVALNTIQLSLENVHESLVKDYDDYAELNKDIENQIITQKSTMEAINQLQAIGKDMLNEFNNLSDDVSDKLTKKLDNFRNNINKNIKTINTTLNTELGNIDLSKLSETVLTLFENKVKELEIQKNEITKIVTDLKISKNELISTKEDIDTSFDNFAKLFNKKVELNKNHIITSIEDLSIISNKIKPILLVSSFIAGLSLGSFGVLFFGLSQVKEKYLEKEVIRKEIYVNNPSELDLKSAEYGLFYKSQKGKHYFAIPENKVKISTKNNGLYFWELKE